MGQKPHFGPLLDPNLEQGIFYQKLWFLTSNQYQNQKNLMAGSMKTIVTDRQIHRT